MSEHKKRAFALIMELQEKKRPLEIERCALWAQIEELEHGIAARVKELRDQVKEVQEKVKPLDALMVEVDQAGKLKSAESANMLLDQLESKI